LPLIEAKELARHTVRLTPYVWQPILDILGYQPKNIYFAPSGMLYLYPIESHRLTDGRLMCEAYRMHRLSSTRWLSYKNDDLQGHDAVVYGGIAYDEDTDCDAGAIKIDRAAIVGLPYLSGSKSEAELITQTINGIRQKGTQARMLQCHQATEASFKALSGQQTRILHIATHGFYRAGKKTETPLDDALQRSGLLFAGANNVWPDGPFNRGANDGVLTADEISVLDLRGMTLTVLSACETGQGDVSGDGVFGLQRGFKKAGANSILMSLWKVDDEATCLLMTEFYRNWIGEKMTKHDALEAAKQTVRSHKEKGWDDPKYWAAFILLDGLD
jgi:CHAT domain-containing protein